MSFPSTFNAPSTSRVTSEWQSLRSSSSIVRLAARESDRQFRAASSLDIRNGSTTKNDRHPKPQSKSADDDEEDFFRIQAKIADVRQRNVRRRRASGKHANRNYNAPTSINKLVSTLERATKRLELDMLNADTAIHLCNLASEVTAHANDRDPLMLAIQDVFLLVGRSIQAQARAHVQARPEVNPGAIVEAGNTSKSDREIKLDMRRGSKSRPISGENDDQSFVGQYRARWAKAERRRAAKPKGDKILSTVLESMNTAIKDNQAANLEFDWASQLLGEELLGSERANSNIT